jgi:hypothetical protein
LSTYLGVNTLLYGKQEIIADLAVMPVSAIAIARPHQQLSGSIVAPEPLFTIELLRSIDPAFP